MIQLISYCSRVSVRPRAFFDMFFSFFGFLQASKTHASWRTGDAKFLLGVNVCVPADWLASRVPFLHPAFPELAPVPPQPPDQDKELTKDK